MNKISSGNCVRCRNQEQANDKESGDAEIKRRRENKSRAENELLNVLVVIVHKSRIVGTSVRYLLQCNLLHVESHLVWRSYAGITVVLCGP